MKICGPKLHYLALLIGTFAACDLKLNSMRAVASELAPIPQTLEAPDPLVQEPIAVKDSVWSSSRYTMTNLPPSLVLDAFSGAVARPFAGGLLPLSRLALEVEPSSRLDLDPESQTARSAAQAKRFSTDVESEVTSTIAQDADPLDTEPVGLPPSLRTEPLSPDELPFQPRKGLLQKRRRYIPSITLLTPSAYGKSWGQVAVGASFLGRVRYREESDASLGVGFGLGNSQKSLGVDVSVGIADVTTFKRGTVGIKLHRILADDWAIAVGVKNAIVWGDIAGGVSPYGVVTKRFQLREDPRSPLSQLYVSAGAGTGRFRSEADVINDRNSVGVFGSVALRLVEQVHFITEWSGQDLSLGLSILPFAEVPLVISPAVTDVTNTAGDGPRFTLGVGLGFTF